MLKISLNSIGDFPEDFILAKKDIEEYLIENNLISERKKLEDFILYLNIQENIFIYGKQTIAFKIMKGKTNEYLIYTYGNEETISSDLEILLEKLNNIDFDLSRLKKSSIEELLTGDLDNPKLFMINTQFYSVD